MIPTRHLLIEKSPNFAKSLATRILLNNPWKQKDYDLKILYIHIPRTGGTSVCQTLYGKTKGHSPLGQFYAFDPSATQSHFKFAIARNPWDRLVSAYHQISMGKAGEKEIGYWNKLKINSFNDLIERLDNTKCHSLLWRMPYLRPQSYYIHSDKVEMDYVGRFETLEQSIHEISRKINTPLPLPHANATKHKPYQSYYDKASIEAVEKFYAEDIDKFGYRFEA